MKKTVLVLLLALSLVLCACGTGSGNPSTESLEWPAYDLENGATMVFDNEPYVGYHHDRELLDLINPDYPY